MRDLLAEHPSIGCVPYDINYLWRIGSETVEHDELVPPLDARAKERVERAMSQVGSPVVVEKTVSNCLRVPLLANAFPEAEFVFLLRDGIDVAESAMRQWQAPIDWRYSLRKALSFPWLTAPRYAIDHVRASLGRSPGNHGATWGPRYAGIDRDIAEHPLAVVCARQWAACVEAAVVGFQATDKQPLVVRYEELVEQPLETVNSAYVRFGLESVDAIQRPVQSGERGKGLRSLSAADVADIRAEVDPITQVAEDWISTL